MEEEHKSTEKISYDSERLLEIQKYKVSMLQRLSDFGFGQNPDNLDQHFTVDPILISELTRKLGPENTVFEVGTGSGNITESISQKGSHVYSLELDNRLEPLLEKRFKDDPNVDLIYKNALDFQIPEETDELIGNPPFSILEPLFKKIVESNIEHINIIVGQNTLRAMEAEIASDDFTLLSLYAQASFRVIATEELENISFYPPPKGKFYRVELIRKRFSQEKEDFLTAQYDKILEQFATFLVENPNYILEQVIRFILENNRAFNKRAKKYNDINQLITIGSIGIHEGLLRKSIGSLNNHEVRKVLQLLIGKINKRFKTEANDNSDNTSYSERDKILLIGVKKAIGELTLWSGEEYLYLENELEKAISDGNPDEINRIVNNALKVANEESIDPENDSSKIEIKDWINIFQEYLNETK